LTEEYRTYLLSDEWKLKRREVIKRAGGRCQTCNSLGKLEVHHRTYKDIFNEKLEDLIALCPKCHALIEGRIKIKPKKQKQQMNPYGISSKKKMKRRLKELDERFRELTKE